MDADWKLEPRRGLGRLIFGLSSDEVAALATVYGKPSPIVSYAHVAADIEKVIATTGGTMSPQDIAAMRREAAALANFATQNLTGEAPILLDYRDLRLVGVACEGRHSVAHFEGQAVFVMTSRDVLALFERANGGPGRYRSTEAAFDNLAASLHAFCSTSREGRTRFLGEADDDFKERSVTLRNEPYRPEREMGEFATFSVL